MSTHVSFSDPVTVVFTNRHTAVRGGGVVFNTPEYVRDGIRRDVCPVRIMFPDAPYMVRDELQITDEEPQGKMVEYPLRVFLRQHLEDRDKLNQVPQVWKFKLQIDHKPDNIIYKMEGCYISDWYTDGTDIYVKINSDVLYTSVLNLNRLKMEQRGI